VELTASTVLEAPPSLEISPSARPIETPFCDNIDNIESKENITEQMGMEEDSISVEYNDETNRENDNHTAELTEEDLPFAEELPLSAASARLDLNNPSDSLEHSSPIKSKEHSFLVQKEEQKQEIRLSKEKQPRRKALLKVAAKGRQILRRVFNRRSAVQSNTNF
jgi:hypothetical protein